LQSFCGYKTSLNRSCRAFIHEITGKLLPTIPDIDNSVTSAHKITFHHLFTIGKNQAYRSIQNHHEKSLISSYFHLTPGGNRKCLLNLTRCVGTDHGGAGEAEVVVTMAGLEEEEVDATWRNPQMRHCHTRSSRSHSHSACHTHTRAQEVPILAIVILTPLAHTHTRSVILTLSPSYSHSAHYTHTHV
jgi:hypothetical protein